MKSHHPIWILTLACMWTAATAVFAQVPARVPAPLAAAAASAPPVVNKAQPRAMTAAEKRDSASVPGDVRPEEPVVPQISIPLGKTPPAPTLSKAQQQRQDKAAAMGGVDDSVARCKAAKTPAERDACLTRLGRPDRAR
jgi:hypothetical protein